MFGFGDNGISLTRRLAASEKGVALLISTRQDAASTIRRGKMPRQRCLRRGETPRQRGVVRAFFVLCLLSFVLPFALTAAPVSSEQAKTAAANWVRQHRSLDRRLGGSVVSATTYTATNGAPFHVVKLDAGFVVTTGDTTLEPVIVHSSGDNLEPDERNPLWVLVRKDIALRAQAAGLVTGAAQKKLNAVNGTAGTSAAQSAAGRKWTTLLAEDTTTSTTGAIRKLNAALPSSSLTDIRVEPLVQSTWGQKQAGGKNVFNSCTPNNYCCGCVATAGSQIMRYFEWPKESMTPFTCKYCKVDDKTTSLTTQGGTYDWANMPLEPSDEITDQESQAIGKLTSDIGISCGMYYKENASSAGGYMLQYALTTHFGYSNAVAMQRSGNCSVDETKRALLSNFDAGLPVAVSVDGKQGGHEIVGDGYGYSDETLYYHFNLGWSGMDDAWYAPPDLATVEWPIAFSILDGFVYNIYTNQTAGAVICSGRVLDSDGNPAAGVTVKASQSSSVKKTVTTNAKGIYALILPAGDYTISAQGAKTSASRDVTLTACVPLRLCDATSSDFGLYWSTPVPSVGNLCEQDIELPPVEKATPVPEGDIVLAIAYGETLGAKADEVVGTMKVDGTVVTGTYVFDAPTAMPAVTSEPQAFTATFRPEDAENYAEVAVSVLVTVGKRRVTVTPTAGQSRFLGETKAIAYTFSPALVGKDAFVGELELASGTVGATTVVKGTLALSDNYELVVVPNVTYTIKQPTFTVTPYVQHPATDAMTVLFFTDYLCEAKVRCWPRDAANPTAVMKTLPASCDEASDLVKVASDETPVWGAQYRRRVRFDGLDSGVTYRYAVEIVGGAAYTNEFKTAPGINTPVRFVAYSDAETIPTSYSGPHDSSADSQGRTKEWDVKGLADAQTYPVSRSVGFASNLLHMAAWKPDLYVVAGDFVARGGVQMFWDEFWKENAGGLGRGYGDPAGSVPILAVMGNHDLYDNNSQSSLSSSCNNNGETGLKKFLSYFEFNKNDVDFANASGDNAYEKDSRDKSQLFHREDYGPVTLLFVDTNNGTDSTGANDSNTSLGSGARPPAFKKGSLQYKWLEANLKDARDVRKSRFIFVVNHHCPYSRGKHNRPQSAGEGQSAAAIRNELTPLLMKYGVAGWLCGHDEMQEHAQVKGTEELSDGSTRDHILNVYDLGSAGDGLKGKHVFADNDKYVVYSAYDDSPDGTHYGHLQVEVAPSNGTWYCTMTPAYSYFAGENSPSELRHYADRIVIAQGGEIAHEERLGDAEESEVTVECTRTKSVTMDKKSFLWNVTVSDERYVAATVSADDNGTATVQLKGLEETDQELSVCVYAGSSTAGKGTLVKRFVIHGVGPKPLVDEDETVDIQQGSNYVFTTILVSDQWNCQVSDSKYLTASGVKNADNTYTVTITCAYSCEPPLTVKIYCGSTTVGSGTLIKTVTVNALAAEKNIRIRVGESEEFSSSYSSARYWAAGGEGSNGGFLNVSPAMNPTASAYTKYAGYSIRTLSQNASAILTLTGESVGEETVRFARQYGDSEAPKDTVILHVRVDPYPVLVRPLPTSRKVGEADPEIAYEVVPATLPNGKKIELAGALVRMPGEDVGAYDVTQGTVTDENNPNYTITFDEVAAREAFEIQTESSGGDEPGGDEPVDGGVDFRARELTIGGNSMLELWILGGEREQASTVQLQALYGTATAADFDLKGVTVNGGPVKSFKFPYTLEWAADERGEQVVVIPVKANEAKETDEFLAFALQNPMNTHIVGAEEKTAEVGICRVTILGPADRNGKVNVLVVPNDATRGKATGSALVQIGKKVTLKATANKGFVFTGWYVDGSLVSRLASYAVTPTNDVEFVANFATQAEDILELGDFLPAEIAVNALYSNDVSRAVASRSVPTISITGLPTGLKFYSKETKAKVGGATYVVPANTVFGLPTKVTSSQVKVTVSNASGRKIVRTYAVSVVSGTASSEPATCVKADAEYHAVTLTRDNDLAGTVTGAGVYQSGKKVTLKATANKEFVFTGWYALDDRVSRLASHAFTMPANDVAYEARFVTAEEDAESICASVNGMPLSDAAFATNVMCGVALQWPVVAEALSQPTVTVGNLPTGLKFTAKPVTAKVREGTKTVTVTNVPANTIYGVPTSVQTKTAKVTVTTSGKSKRVYELKITVDPLPAYAQGSFDGPVNLEDGTTNGVATLTVAANGKVSGSVQQIENGKNVKYTLTATSLSDYDLKSGDFTLRPAYKAGSVTKTIELRLAANVADKRLGIVAGGSDDFSLALYQNVWKNSETKDDRIVAPYVGSAVVEWMLDELKLTVKKSCKTGVVTIGGKVGGTSVSGSAQAYWVPEDEEHRAVIYIAPKGAAFGGMAEVLPVEFD